MMKIMKWALGGLAFVLLVMAISPVLAKAQSNGHPECRGVTPIPPGHQHHDPAKVCDTPPDTTPPVVSISGPGTYPPPQGEIANWVESTSATVTFSANESATFECYIHPYLKNPPSDTTVWEPCTSPLTFTNLVEGGKYVAVRATDAAGNVSQGETIWIWQVDTKAPYAQITGEQPAVINTDSLRVSFTGSDECCTSGGLALLTPEVSLDGGAWVEATKTYDAGSYMTGHYDLANLSEGQHSLELRITDAAGHVSNIASYTFTVDTTPPETVISGQQVETEGSGGPGTVRLFVAMNDPEPSPPELDRFECKLIGPSGSGIFEACPTSIVGGGPPTSGEWQVIYTGLVNGNYTLEVRAKDPAGNVDPTPSSTTFVIDGVPG